MSRLRGRPSDELPLDVSGRLDRFSLRENPFPSEPVVNKDSTDRRINGDIFEMEIRRKEYDQVLTSFITQPQSNANHLRLGYIIDTSYIGRGNGKSAFLINLQQNINREYSLDISNGLNKCFAIYVTPEPGGRTKTFPTFVDIFFQSILSANIIKECLAILRLEAVTELYDDFDPDTEAEDENTLIDILTTKSWFEEHNYDVRTISNQLLQNKYLQDLPTDFTLFAERQSLLKPFVSQTDFEEYYFYYLKKPRDKINFVFSHLVRLFQAAGFNGAYVLVDDFECIPDFQSARQKRDFALELRASLFDGPYVNARIGFYTLFLTLHAGVPRLIDDAWAASGMENRAPISPQIASKHIIPFEKLTKQHASMLLIKYLAEYRINAEGAGPLLPFTEEAVSMIGELSEYNAAKILQMAYVLLDKASEIESQNIIDDAFVIANKGFRGEMSENGATTILGTESTDLIKKAKSQE